jgi:hypothetical protein
MAAGKDDMRSSFHDDPLGDHARYGAHRASNSVGLAYLMVFFFSALILVGLLANRNTNQFVRGEFANLLNRFEPQEAQNKAQIEPVKMREELEAEADENNNIIFREEIPDVDSVKVSIEPRVSGEYLFYAENCSISSSKNNDAFKDIGNGDRIFLSTSDSSLKYFVECLKNDSSDVFEFRLLYVNPNGEVTSEGEVTFVGNDTEGLSGRGGPVPPVSTFVPSRSNPVQPNTFRQTGGVSQSSQPVGSSSQPSTGDDVFTPTNNFSPNNTNNFSPSVGGSSGGGSTSGGGTSDGGGSTTLPELPGLPALPQAPSLPSL